MKKVTTMASILFGATLLIASAGVDLSAGEMKCGSGKCGGAMEKPVKKSAAAKCGTSEKKDMKCGSGKCGGEKKAKKTMKCGSGKCGGN